MKLMMDLRERVVKFDLPSEYLNLFMAHFREASELAYEVAVGRVAANPRMAVIAEQMRAFESSGKTRLSTERLYKSKYYWMNGYVPANVPQHLVGYVKLKSTELDFHNASSFWPRLRGAYTSIS